MCMGNGKWRTMGFMMFSIIIFIASVVPACLVVSFFSHL
jgi:hypothetical protein